MSVQPRELLAKPQSRRAGFVLLALFAGVGGHFGCGPSQDNLFSNSKGGASALGGSSGSGGSSPASGGVGVSTGGSLTTGGSSAATGGSPPTASGGADAGGAGGDGSAGDSGLGGSPSSGGSAPTGGAAGSGGVGGTGGASGGNAGTGGGPTGPVLESGSRQVAAFKGLHCESIDFPTAFTVPAADVLIQATAVHPAATITHGAMALWVQTASATGFEVCMIEDTGLNGSHLVSRLDWVAYAMPSVSTLGFTAGRAMFAAVSGRSCQSVTFATALSAAPQLQVTPNHRGAASGPSDPVTAWVEDVTEAGFRLCAEEVEGTDGDLDGTTVDWLAYPATFAGAGFSAGERNVGGFDGVQCVDIPTGCANCENIQVSVNHRRRNEAATASHDATLIWAEDMTAAGVLTACVSQTSAYAARHDTHLSIDWLARQKND